MDQPAIQKNRFIKIIFVLILTLLLVLLFSYKLLDVPMGLTVDETALGYNATLLSRNGHDENGRFLPFFVLSNDGQDWKQPVTQYYLALLFKIFQPSIYLLRFSSIIITIFSSYLLFIFVKKLINPKYALISVFIFLTTPLIMIHSHLGLDNIMPIPFTIIWLFGLYAYSVKPDIKYLLLSSFSLGISFYTYKGMRAVVPVWLIISCLYIFYQNLFRLKSNIKKSILQTLLYSLFISPFIIAIPFLQTLYPGSILGGSRPRFESVYNFLYPYFSSFDFTFLYIKGDDTPFHSTGIHGMMLLATLPLFLLGIYHSIRQSKFSKFILISYFSAPLLYGTVDSVHRASRLMALIPIYSIICAYGYQFIRTKLKYSSLIIITVFILSIINYADFVHYYWNTYAKMTQSFLGDLKPYLSFKELKTQSTNLNLKPYLAQDINYPFFESLYFPQGITKIHQDLASPNNSILLTNRHYIPSMTRLNTNLKYYYLQFKSDSIK